MILHIHSLPMHIHRFQTIWIVDFSSSQLSFDALDALLLFVRGSISKDKIHIFERLKPHVSFDIPKLLVV